VVHDEEQGVWMEWFRGKHQNEGVEDEAGDSERRVEAEKPSPLSNAGWPAEMVPAEPEPTDDEFASMIAIVLVSDTNETELAGRLGTTQARTRLIVQRLLERGTMRDSGGGYYQSGQLVCAGSCERRGDLLLGQEVVIDRATLAWWCGPCWSSRPARTREVS
jgi:hypothetical protein